MAGLNPEQIAQIRSYEIAGERTRQQPIGAMIEAQFGLGREALQQQQAALLQAQEERTRALFGPELEYKRAQTRSAIATAGLHESQRIQFDQLSDLKKRELQSSVEGLDALTATRRMSAALDAERLKQAELQGPLELQKAKEEIAYRRAATGDIGKAREQAQEQFKATHLPTTLPGGYEREVPAADVYKTLTGGEKGGLTEYQRLNLSDKEKQRLRQATGDERKLQDDAQKAEANVLGKNTKGQFNIQDPSVVTDMDEFNRKSDKDYFYEYIPPTKGVPDWMGGAPEHRRIYLRSKEGKPLQARAVNQAWEEFKAKNGPISRREYVDKFLGGPK